MLQQCPLVLNSEHVLMTLSVAHSPLGHNVMASSGLVYSTNAVLQYWKIEVCCYWYYDFSQMINSNVSCHFWELKISWFCFKINSPTLL